MARRALLVLSAVTILIRPLAGQQPQTNPPPAQPPVFRSGTDLVRLDVRVTDADGRPVRDMRPDEIEVREGGRVLPILFFQHIDEPTESYNEVARRTITSEVSTNRGAPRGHLYLLVFDQQHISAGNELRARLAAERFLKTHVRRGDRVALYAFPGPGPAIPFTGDLDRVIAGLSNIRGTLERTGVGVLGTMATHEAYEIARGNELALARVSSRLATESTATDVQRTSTAGAARASAQSDTGNFPRLVQEDARTIVARADEESRRFLLLLSQFMRELRWIEGRKAVVLISEGFHGDHLSRELEQAAAAAASTYSVIYALDLNRRVDLVGEQSPLGANQQMEIQSRIDPLGSLAVETDGRLVNDASPNLDREFRRIAEESQDYYVVGFAPVPTSRKESEYRRVSVVVNRPGLRVSTRTGYSLNTSVSTPADRRVSIDRAFSAPYPQQGLPIELTTYALRGDSPGAHRVLLSLSAELPVRAASGPQSADVVFAVRSARDGKVMASGTDVVPLPDAARLGWSVGRGNYRVQFDVPPGEYLMRVVVREPGGLVGSVDRRFEVRALNTRDVAVSDLFLGSSEEGLPVRTRVRHDEVLGGLLEIYAPAAEPLENVDVVAELASLAGAPALTSVRADLERVASGKDGFSRVARIQLPLSGVPQGEYLVRVTVRAKGETVGQRAREVEITDQSIEPGPTMAARIDPRDVLSGEVAHQLLAAIRKRASDPGMTRGVDIALAGGWDHLDRVPAPADSPDRLVLKGMAAFATRDFAGAATTLRAAVATSLPDARVAFMLGWAYSMAGDDRNAIGAWRNTVRLDSRLIPAHLALVDTFVRLAHPELAAQAVQAGLAAIPDSVELRDRLARLESR